ncbi:MAG: ubiquinone/menaquinone biosynthesis C-methylase UbiE [Gammaproteobacteria bacterium]|jgi:ubiquinone/menaquinone biosynthesis C-methylase UbiE
MNHLQRVEQEFTRQADTFAAYAANADTQLQDRFREALGSASQGAILDLACGPGVVSAAISVDARKVVAFDVTPAMLDKARQRCANAGRDNVEFQHGDAEHLPFDDGVFDGVVTRLAIHHFQDPARVLNEVFRVLRPAGRLVIADVVVSENSDEAALQNAIENLRDPSHVRMLAATELDILVNAAGFEIIASATWSKAREFEEWMGIANEPLRTQSLRIVAKALAEDGRTAGMGLSIENNKLVFFHQWRLIAATRTDSAVSVPPVAV